jgi:hypothetical protein
MYPTLAVVLIIIGLILMSVFFVYQMRPASNKSIMTELVAALLASIALGFGTLFLMLAFGLYV